MAVSVPAAPTRRADHRCCVFEDRLDFRRAAVEYLAEGLADGRRLLYVGDRPVSELALEIADIGDVAALRSQGALVIDSLLGLYRPRGAFEAGEQVERYRALTQQALDDGYTGIRVAADASALVESADARRRFVGYEVAVDRLIAGISMSAMCGYEVGRVGRGVRDLCAVHAEDNGVGELSPGFRLSFEGDGLRLAGEIDLANSDLFELALDAAVACSDLRVVIDASELAFIDVRSMLSLAERRRALIADGRDLVLVSPRPVVERCAAVLEVHGVLETPAAEAAR